MRALNRWSLSPLVLVFCVAGCGRQESKGSGAATSASTANAPGTGGDMMSAEACAPSTKTPKPSPGQVLATRRDAAEKELGTLCGRVAADVVAGKPLPTGSSRLDADNEMSFDGGDYRKTLDALADRVRICRALQQGSCDAFSGEARDKCEQTRDFYQAAKRAPADKSFRFTPWQEEHFRMRTGKPELVAAYAKAVRTRDPASCPKELPFCPAMATLDAKKCAGPDLEGCRYDVARYALVEKGGLEKLREAGTPDEQLRARAALGQPDACDASIAELKRSCADLTKVSPSLRVEQASAGPPSPSPPRAAPSPPK